MSVLLRFVFVFAGYLVALFIARDALNFELVQTWVAIGLAGAAIAVASLWSLRQKA